MKDAEVIEELKEIIKIQRKKLEWWDRIIVKILTMRELSLMHLTKLEIKRILEETK